MNRPPAPSCLRLFRPLFTGILCRPVPFAVVALVYAVTLFGLGDFLAAPGLFWHEDWLPQLLAGAGVGLLFAEVCFVAFLLDDQERVARKAPAPLPANGCGRWLEKLVWQGHRLTALVVPIPPRRREETPYWRRLRWYLAGSLLPLLLVLVMATLVYLNVSDRWPAPPRGASEAAGWTPYFSAGWSWVVPIGEYACLVFPLWERWPFLAGLVVTLVLVRLFIRIFHLLRGRGFLFGRLDLTHWTGWQEIVLHLAIAFLFGFFVVVPWTFVPTLLRCFLVGLWAACHGGVVFMRRIPAQADEHRWKHLLAGMASLTFFVLYEVQFAFFCLGGPFGGSPWLSSAWISPALVVCLLLALLTAGYGFLKFHFQGRRLAIVGLPLAAAVAFGTLMVYLTDPPLTFPGLDAYYKTKVELADADFPAIMGGVRNAEDDLNKIPSDDTIPEDARKAKLEGAREEWRARLCGPVAHACRLLLDRYNSQLAAEGDPADEVPLPEWGREGDSAAIQAWADRLRTNLINREYARLDRWKNQFPASAKPKLAVVAVSGGASRAAFWTATVLHQLEDDQDQLPSFPAHVRVIAGASGGMVGASYWTSTLSAESGHATFDAGSLASDDLTPVAQSLLFVDFPMLFAPVPRPQDRGRALEEAWRKNLGLPFEPTGTFRGLAEGEKAGWRPSLIFSPAFVEDGKRLFISNLYLPFLTENTGNSLSIESMVREPVGEKGGPQTGVAALQNPGPAGKAAASTVSRPPSKQPRRPGSDKDRTDDQEEGAYRYSLPGVEFFRLFPGATQFTLGTAARMNASFPYISPAVDIPTNPRRRVVDAGYYDNYGVDVATAWILHYRDWIRYNTSGVVLIQIRDSPSGRDLFLETSTPRGLGRSIEWLTGPLEGALEARDSVMSFRNDEQVQALSRLFNRDRPDLFTTVVFECDEPIEMSWRLTRDEKERMVGRGGLKSPAGQDALGRLKDWWGRPHEPVQEGRP